MQHRLLLLLVVVVVAGLLVVVLVLAVVVVLLEGVQLLLLLLQRHALHCRRLRGHACKHRLHVHLLLCLHLAEAWAADTLKAQPTCQG